MKRSKPIFRLEPVDTVFDADVTGSLLHYERNKKKFYVGYDDFFAPTRGRNFTRN